MSLKAIKEKVVEYVTWALTPLLGALLAIIQPIKDIIQGIQGKIDKMNAATEPMNIFTKALQAISGALDAISSAIQRCHRLAGRIGGEDSQPTVAASLDYAGIADAV